MSLPSSEPVTPNRLPDEPCIAVLRPLVEAYLAFTRESDRHIERLGLTSGQFDVIVTLGDTPGMCCRELSEKTLVTKGTLTGVLDRLTKKGLIVGESDSGDRRIRIIQLTEKGQETYRRVFPEHLSHMKPYFDRFLSKEETETLRGLLLKLRDGFLAFGAESNKKS
jgi:MarR family 2-MHQ and catechol resistance regulon transcriptional repressor